MTSGPNGDVGTLPLLMPTTRSQAKKRDATHLVDETSVKQEGKLGTEEDIKIETPSPSKRVKRKPGRIPYDDEKSKTVRFKEESRGLTRIAEDPQYGLLERGHIYFWYRPKVQLEEAHDFDDVAKFYILLLPSLGVGSFPLERHDGIDVDEKLPEGKTTKPFRLILVGKKKLPDPDTPTQKGRRKEIFWAAVTAAGDDLDKLEQGLGPKDYETKTRGSRHQEEARLVGRGAYAIVSNHPSVPSTRETHLGYHLSHPNIRTLGDVQETFAIHTSSSFLLQVKNPLAPTPMNTGLSRSKKAEYPSQIMTDVFGAGGRGGREEYGRRFVSANPVSLLDYEGCELLLIASKAGKKGLDGSVGEENAAALRETTHGDTDKAITEVFKELNLEAAAWHSEPLKGEWI